MARAIVFSLLALVFVMFAARGCGVTPEQIESRIMLAELNAEEGARFRQTNRLRDGVVELSDGLQLEWLARGDGAVPSDSDWIVVHYRGKHIDGRVFDESYRRGEPAVVSVDRVIEGWRRVLTGMPTGSRVSLVVPPELAYGKAGGGVIGPDETLVFELELIAIEAAPAQTERTPDQHPVPGLR